MAITTVYPGLQVDVVVNGAPLQEYDDDEDEDSPDTTTKYVEATSGANFEIRYSFGTGFSAKHAVVTRVHVDGQYGEGHVIKLDEIFRFPRFLSGRREDLGDGYFQRKFRFAQLSTDDSGLGQVEDALMKKLKEIGTITVKFTWAMVNGPSHYDPLKSKEIPKIGTIPEKALKGRAVSSQVVLGDRETIRPFTTVSTTDLDGGKPFATFKFKYRSRSALQSLLVIPRSPSPVPLEERDINTLNPEEMRELLKRQKEREEAARKIKTEGVKREHTRDSVLTVSGDEDDEEVSFVSEKRRKLNFTIDEAGVETIDLT
ncbi:hypothetical protein K458DRAFT_163912 [Lentithecium fluviatile CBS 122367]|uniref:DUF7918 domain-containing protein n=1 Tax=Lentithecium fluviatile CBS 122367 TaxID=1168545 RepID=A0A6G1IGF0_9PLEO|nr:hypothetical protein K458DRAFT_163912 [Lentithecium fluviatile CBS 122367]